MSNVKDVHLMAVMPYGFEQEESNNELVQFLGRMMLNPFQGIKVVVAQFSSPTTKNRIHLILQGQEAMSFVALEHLMRLLANASAETIDATVVDIEAQEGVIYAVTKEVLEKVFNGRLFRQYCISTKQMLSLPGQKLSRGDEFRGGRVTTLSYTKDDMWYIETEVGS